MADDGGPVATPERRPDASSESGKKPKKDAKSKQGDIDGLVGNRNLPSSSSDGRGTKCGCCQQTNKSRPFARDEGYVEAPADACLDHYLKWQPCSVFVTWACWCRMYNNDAEHRASVDNYDVRPGTKLAPQKAEATGVAVNSRVFFRIKRPGIFMEGDAVKKACHNSTWKQLGLDEKNISFPIQVQDGSDNALSGYLFCSDKEKALQAEVSVEMCLGVDSIIKSPSQVAPVGMDQMAMTWARQHGFWQHADNLSDFLRGKGVTLGEVKERGWKAEEKRQIRRGNVAEGDEGNDNECSESGDSDSDSDSSSSSNPGGPCGAADVEGESVAKKWAKIKMKSVESEVEIVEHKLAIYAGQEFLFEVSSKALLAANESAPEPEVPDDISDTGSVCTAVTDVSRKTKATSKGKAKKKANGQTSLPPNYWIAKVQFVDAIMNRIDARDTRQSNNAVARESADGKDNDGASRLKEHLAAICVVMKAGKEICMTASWQEVYAAYVMMRLRGIFPHISNLIALVKKKAAEAAKQAHSTDNSQEVRAMAYVVKMYHESPITQIKFDIKHPRLCQLMSVISLRQASEIFWQGLWAEFLAKKFRTCDDASHVKSLSTALAAVQQELELPDDVDIPAGVIR